MVTLMFSRRKLWFAAAALLLLMLACGTSAYALATTQGFAITFGDAQVAMPAGEEGGFVDSLSKSFRDLYISVTGGDGEDDDMAGNGDDQDGDGETNGDVNVSTSGPDTQGGDENGGNTSTTEDGDCLLGIDPVCANADTEGGDLSVDLNTFDDNTLDANVANEPENTFVDVDPDGDEDDEVSSNDLLDEVEDVTEDVEDLAGGLLGGDD